MSVDGEHPVTPSEFKHEVITSRLDGRPVIWRWVGEQSNDELWEGGRWVLQPFYADPSVSHAKDVSE